MMQTWFPEWLVSGEDTIYSLIDVPSLLTPELRFDLERLGDDHVTKMRFLHIVGLTPRRVSLTCFHCVCLNKKQTNTYIFHCVCFPLYTKYVYKNIKLCMKTYIFP